MIDVSLITKDESEMYSQAALWLGLLNLRPVPSLFIMVQGQDLKKGEFG